MKYNYGKFLQNKLFSMIFFKPLKLKIKLEKLREKNNDPITDKLKLRN